MPAAPTSYANESVFTVQLRMDQSRKKFFDTGSVSTTFSTNEQSFDLAVVQFDDDGHPVAPVRSTQWSSVFPRSGVRRTHRWARW